GEFAKGWEGDVGWTIDRGGFGVLNGDGLGATAGVSAFVSDGVGAVNGAATGAAAKRTVGDRQREIRSAIVSDGATQSEEFGNCAGRRRDIAQALDGEVGWAIDHRRLGVLDRDGLSATARLGGFVG